MFIDIIVEDLRAEAVCHEKPSPASETATRPLEE
jgi:hypothetical protein